MGTLQAGFARVDITPPLGIYLSGYYEPRRALGVHDPLYASAMAVHEGDKTAILMNLDIIGIKQELLEEYRRCVAEAISIQVPCVFIACTHTHTGPVTGGDLFPADSVYNERLGYLLAQAAVQAVNDLSAAELRYGCEKVPGISFIRRFKMKDGSTRTNPGVGNPAIDHPIGQPDERMQLVRVVRERGPEILLVNFAVHPDVVGGGGALSKSGNDTFFSADYPGFLRETVEGAIPGTRLMFFNGAEGDVNHINVHADPATPMNGYDFARHMARCLAAGVLRAYTRAKPLPDGSVDGAEQTLLVEANKGLPEQLPLARDYVRWHDEGRDDLIPETGMGVTMLVAEAQRMLTLADAPDRIPLRLTALRFGGVCIAGIPGEPFGEIGRIIRRESPFEAQLVSCCANGYEGYFPMRDAFDEGGYEARSSSFKAGVGETVAQASGELVHALFTMA